MAESSLINTGIKGLDEILLGGIPSKNVILVQGAAGTGKCDAASTSVPYAALWRPGA